jgi:hypothetical protein
MPRGDPIMQTFGDHVYQFANSVDIVPLSVYYEALGLIEDYLKENLNTRFFAVVIDKMVKLKPFLVSEWPHEKPWWEERVKTDQDQYVGQTALGYALGKPLWIVGENQRRLMNEDRYVDLLGNVESNEIPKYQEIEDIETRTSIILPLRIGDSYFGVINLESPNYLPRSYQWLAELRKLANAIAILHRLKDINILQTNTTKAARDYLKAGVDDRAFVPVTGRNDMFFASSSRADQQVLAIMKEVLSSYKTDFDLVHWTDISHGDIHDEIWSNISACTYGVCYFSEPENPESPHRFRDNPNVLFEAGMLFALRRARRTPLKAIILVREPDATAVPFDFNSEYITLVPRKPAGELDTEKFRAQLTRHVQTILSKQ